MCSISNVYLNYDRFYNYNAIISELKHVLMYNYSTVNGYIV